MWCWPTCPGESRKRLTGRVENQDGVALILAVAAVFLLSVAVMQTRAGVDLAREITVSAAQELQAFYMARSGLALVQEALADDDPQVDSYGDDWAAANEVGALPIGDMGWATGKVTDEEGKLSILDLVNADGETDENTDIAALRLLDLLVILGLSDSRAEEIVDSLVDWMDFDESVTGSGAETSYYSSLPHPYSCPNDFPDSIDDLALVKGIGPVLLYRGEGEVPPLIDFVTIYGKKKAGDLYRRVNLNTAPYQVLMALSPEIDLQLAEEIVASRKEEAFTAPAQVKDVPGFPGEEFFATELAPLIDVSSSHFSARITGETSMASIRAFGIIRREGEGVELVYYKGF